MLDQVKKENSLFNKVVKGGYCIGCGTCTAISNSPVEILMDNQGQYQASLKRDINELEDNSLMSVCPFSSIGPDEDEIGNELFGKVASYDDHIGYYINNYAGYVSEGNFRDNGSSGGMGTWILKELFIQGLIDRVIHIREGAQNNKLFQFAVSTSIIEIENSAKSRYYPVEMSDVLKIIRDVPGKYAIVGVPCFIKSIRLLSKSEQIFKERINFCVGLVCGHLKSEKFADMIGMQFGFKSNQIKSLNFRKKIVGRRADDYGVEINGLDDNSSEKIVLKPTKEIFGTNWGQGLFKYKACDYCDDVLAETADVTVGDAWLPEYVNSSLGTNVVVVRNPIINKIIKNANDANKLNLVSISAKKVALSQAGGLRHRREGLSYRLFLKDEIGEWRPKKRVVASNNINKKRKIVYKLRIKLSDESIKAYRKAEDRKDFNVFKRELEPLINTYNKVTFVPLWLRIVSKGIRVVQSKFRK